MLKIYHTISTGVKCSMVTLTTFCKHTLAEPLEHWAKIFSCISSGSLFTIWIPIPRSVWLLYISRVNKIKYWSDTRVDGIGYPALLKAVDFVLKLETTVIIILLLLRGAMVDRL